MSRGEILLLALQIAASALFSFGGITVVLVQLQDTFVDRHTLLTDDQFWQSYALSSVAPGPNGPIFMSFLGWEVSGAVVLGVCLVAWAVPTLAVMYALGRLGDQESRPEIGRLLGVLKAIAVGLLAAGTVSMVTAFDFQVRQIGIGQLLLAVAASVVLWRKWLTPLPTLAVCMTIGALLLG